jgi:hypothetical protein
MLSSDTKPYSQERGTDDLDITSYHPDQRTWAGAKANRPEILFQYEKWGRPKPDHPINLPSREAFRSPADDHIDVEGWRMGAWMRLDSRITYEDVRARMVINALRPLVRIENIDNAVLRMKAIMDLGRHHPRATSSRAQPSLDLIQEMFQMMDQS